MEHSGKNIGEIGPKILNALSLVPGKFWMNYLVMLELRQHFCSLLQAAVQNEKPLIEKRFHKFDGIMRLPSRTFVPCHVTFRLFGFYAK
jgi:hypothetical protein